MKKKSVYVVFTVVALALAVSLCACKKKEGDMGNNKELSQILVVNDGGNNVSVRADVPQTEIIERAFEISPFQSGTITIRKNVSEGDLFIDIIPKDSYTMLDGVAGATENEEIINVPEGAGSYQVRIDAENFVGSCEVIWESKDIYTEEDFASALGYNLKYVPEKFNYKNENGKETFALKSNNENEAELYFSVYMVDAANKETEKTRLKEGAEVSSDCIFDEGKLLGDYATFPQDNGTEIMRFLFDLNDGRMLVIETLQYDEMGGNAAANAYIKGLISSFSYEQ